MRCEIAWRRGSLARFSGDEMIASVQGIPFDDLPTSISWILLLVAASCRKYSIDCL
jgi:hypothetical protein